MQATSFFIYLSSSNMTFLLTCSERMFSHLVLTIYCQGILTNTYLDIPTLKQTIMEANPNERKHHSHVPFVFFTNPKRKSVMCLPPLSHVCCLSTLHLPLLAGTQLLCFFSSLLVAPNNTKHQQQKNGGGKEDTSSRNLILLGTYITKNSMSWHITIFLV
jgi:hypothetical protein